jgi:hypothetical protein
MPKSQKYWVRSQHPASADEAVLNVVHTVKKKEIQKIPLYLNVKMLESSTGVRHHLDPLIGNQLTAAHAQLPDSGAGAGEGAQPQVCDVTLPDVQGAEARGAAQRHRLQAQVAHTFASPQVQVSDQERRDDII